MMCNVYGYFIVCLHVLLLAFHVCCHLWCMISLCCWYLKLCLLVGCCILVLCNVARNDVNDKIISNTYLERRRWTRFQLL
ncbi:hypothetical protein BC941DRAFT_518987 [Chlamydoabsidia padenii]|nr:hypothetical protein BC941DRAFT_518987 [Chlamydoabsidia padenii]